MEIHRLRKTEGGASGWFSGQVYLEVLVPARPEGESLFLVRFAPRGRTAWHTHPQGQVLYVAEGVGLAQSRGARAQLLLPGDMVVFAPGEEHWHGALPDRFMAHLALQKADGEGKTAYWGEEVAEEAYLEAAREALEATPLL
ncbi:cupin domain-containing protein [Thermus sediminis]|uniref:cupin domain-containing protein n=1 Tax=Thermus sediminis TaxID=1761908 RepID=UPI000E3B6739|nr:cupin domain-containing protein [Thermus sediminis]